MRESFIFYDSFLNAIEELEPDIQLQVYQAITKYSLRNELPKLTGIAKAIFTLIKPQIDANNKRYENGKKGAGFGVLGGRPKKQKPQENPKETPNVNDNVNDNVNVNVNVNDNVNLIPLKKKTDFLLNPIIDKVFDIYKEECPNLIKIGSEPKNIKKREFIQTYLDETDSNLDYFREVCKKANKLKKIGKFQIDFEMLIKYHNRIDTGYYSNADDTFDYMEYLKEQKK